MMRVTLPGKSLKTTGRWLQDYSDRSVLLPGGITLDPAQFADSFHNAIKLRVRANANATATTVLVDKFSGTIPAKTIVALGAGKFVRLTASATDADTLAVEAIPTALAAGDSGQYLPPNALQVVEGGTVVGKLRSEALFGPADPADDEIYFLWKTVDLKREGYTTEAVRRGLIFEAFLPNGGTQITSALKTTLLDRNFQFGNYDGSGADE